MATHAFSIIFFVIISRQFYLLFQLYLTFIYYYLFYSTYYTAFQCFHPHVGVIFILYINYVLTFKFSNFSKFLFGFLNLIFFTLYSFKKVYFSIFYSKYLQTSSIKLYLIQSSLITP